MRAGSLAPGALLAGKFRILGSLGEGGMAIVLSAHHEGLDIRVALKVLKHDAARKPEVRARFGREARAVAALRSEHVARVLDVGETEDGRPFIVIEHLEGRDLAQVVRDEGPLPVARAVDLVLQACVGLADAHARKIVHRDVKPANLFMTRQRGTEIVKVLDFGISKIVLAEGTPNPIETGAALMGSPAYMSPEQLRASSHVDARSDVWSLGAVLYELLTGVAPFGGAGTDFYRVITSILHDHPAQIRAQRPDVSEALDTVVFRTLEKDPAARVSSAAELAVLLAPFGGPTAGAFAERAAAAGTNVQAAPPSSPEMDTTAATLYVPAPRSFTRPRIAPPPPAAPVTAAGSTRAASGVSSATDTVKAVRDAVQRAQAGLDGRRATMAFLFASSRHDIGRAAEEIGLLTHGAAVVACSTAGEITERGLTKRSLVVLLVASDDLRAHVTFAAALERNPELAISQLCEGFDVAALAARHVGLGQWTTVILLDGLSGVGEAIVDGVLRNTRGYQRLVGGAAADDGAFQKTQVATKERSTSGGAVAAHVFSNKPWGIGVAHGLEPATERMRVTRALGNRVIEIDRRPAFEVYRDYAKARYGVELTVDRAGPFLVANEMGVYYFDSIRHARAGLRVERDGSVLCAAPVTEGASICFLSGDPVAMAEAARRAAIEAAEQLNGSPAAGVLVFDCVCREAMMGDGFAREISAIAEVFPQAAIAGFLTYGEIARARGRLEGWHNATVVVVAIPA